MSTGREVLPGARRRAVILGASNVIRSVAVVIQTTRQVLGNRPLDIYAAVGHGRSYGMRSSVLGRTLPAIADCGLWRQLDGSAGSCVALVTDVGNDILYGASPEQTCRWVQTCLARLVPISTRVVVTRLPLASLSRLTPRRYLFFRTLLFPRCRLDLKTVMDRAAELDERIAQLASRHGAVLVQPRDDWFALDPIHMRRKWQIAAWKEILQPWDPKIAFPDSRASLFRHIFLTTRRSEDARWLGLSIAQRQPAARFSDGSTLSFY